MNKVELGLLIVIVGILLYVGGLVYYEMVMELEEHPEIKDIGGPPVITDLRLVTIVVVGAMIICGIILKTKPIKDKEEMK